MLRKIIAGVLVAALLVQCAPMAALAEAANVESHLLPQSEIDALVAKYASDSLPTYHAGMAYSDAFGPWQVYSYLQYLQTKEIEPLMNTVEMIVTAVAKTLPAQKPEDEKLKTLDAFMFYLHQLKDEISYHSNELAEALADIPECAEHVWDEAYGDAARVACSRRIEDAVKRIDATCKAVSEKRLGWEEDLSNAEEAIREDGSKDVHIAANGMDGGYVSFSERLNTGVQGERDGGWQLRDLYSEVKPKSEPKIYTVSAQEMGLERAPSLLERLTPVKIAYADRDQDALVTIISDDQFAITVEDENGKPIPGASVRAIDADRMYEILGRKEAGEDIEPTFYEKTANENGVAVFDIPNQFTLDEDDTLNLYVEVSEGTGTLARSAANGEEPPARRSATHWQLELKRGGTYAESLGVENGQPYLICAEYNALDMLRNERTIYHSSANDIEQELYLQLGGLEDPANTTVSLRYTSVVEEKTGPQKGEVKTIDMYAPDKNGATMLWAKFCQILMPGEKVQIVVKEPGEDEVVLDLHLKVESPQTDMPYSGETSKLDLGPNTLFSYSPSWAPGLSFSLNLPFLYLMPSVVYVQSGALFVTLGVKGPLVDKSWAYKKQPEVEAPEGAPSRPTESNWACEDKLKNAKMLNKLSVLWTKLKTSFLKGRELFPPYSASNSILKPMTGVSTSFTAYLSFSGHLIKQEETADGTRCKLVGSASLGASWSLSGEIYFYYVCFFVGASASATVGAVFTVGVTTDVLWRAWDDWKRGSFQFDAANTGIEFYVKIGVELFLGFGIKGFLEGSIHGYAYIVLLLDVSLADTGVPNPHAQITGTFGAYGLFVIFLLLRVRYDIKPPIPGVEFGKEYRLADNWDQEDYDKQSSPSNAVRSAPNALTAPNAPPASNDGDSQTPQQATSDTVVCNEQMIFDAAKEGALAQIDTLDGKVYYARISDKKFDPNTTAAIHTYAFFLSPADKTTGYSYLQYIDLDAKKPKVYDFETERKANKQDSKAWNDYAVAVTSVSDMLGKSYGGTTYNPGSSAVVCVLSSTATEDQQVTAADGVTATVKRPSGRNYATIFVASRDVSSTDNDETGKLTLYTSVLDTLNGKNEVVHCKENSMQFTELKVRQGQAQACYQNPQISALFDNGERYSPPGVGSSAFNAYDVNVYEAFVLLGALDGDEEARVTPALRYRASAYNEDDAIKNDLSDVARTQMNRMSQEYLSLWEKMTEKQAFGGIYKASVGGKQADYAILPVRKMTDTNRGALRYLWTTGEYSSTSLEHGPLGQWMEIRSFDDGLEDMLYHFYEKPTVGEDFGLDDLHWVDGTNMEEDIYTHLDWQPYNDNGRERDTSLIGREGTKLNGIVIPWNAPADNDVVFFFFEDKDGVNYLDSLRLSDNVMTDYSFSAHAAYLGGVDTGETITLYWLSSHTPDPMPDGTDGPHYSLDAMIYDKDDCVLFDAITVKEIATPDDAAPAQPFVAEDGTCYFALTGGASEEDDQLVITTEGNTTLNLYRFTAQNVAGVDLTSASFEDVVARPGMYDTVDLAMQNTGNAPISRFTIDVYDVNGDKETKMETIHANLIDPTQSYVEYAGTTDKRTETGETVIKRDESYTTLKDRSKWLVNETKCYGGESDANSDTVLHDWYHWSCYLTTKLIIPGDAAAFSAPIYLSEDWTGDHKIRFRVSEVYSVDIWAVDFEGQEMREQEQAKAGVQSTRKAAAPLREVVYRRKDNGETEVSYATGGPLGAPVGESENFSLDFTFDMLDLDTSKEDVEMTYRFFTRENGEEMAELTVSNRAVKDGEDKCVLLYAYADYDYQNAWPVYDFGDVNAGESVTIVLPLALIKNGREMNELTLDLHIDHDHGMHSTSGIDTSCDHDLHIFDDVVTITVGRPDLVISKQPIDQHTVTGAPAHFEVAVKGGGVPYYYRWQVRKPLLDKNGRHILDKDGKWKYGEWEDLPDETKITLDLVATAEMNGWQFQVIVTDGYGESVTSAFATLWLTDVPMTGDDAHPELWLLLACAALMTALLAARKRDRRREE